jgi:endonuclease G
MTTSETDEMVATLRRLAESDPAGLDALIRELANGRPDGEEVPDVIEDHCHDKIDEPGEELHPGEDGAVDLADMPTVERIIGTDNQLPVHFLSRGDVVQRAVARVEVPGGFGSGSLVSDSLLLTNNHVIRTAEAAANSRARFNFQRDHAGVDAPADVYDLNPASFFYTNAALDFTVVRVRSKFFPVRSLQSERLGEDGNTMPTAATHLLPIDTALIDRVRLPQLSWMFSTPGARWGHLRLPSSGPSYAVNQYYNVIGHPRGRRKEVALQDNKVTNVFTNVVRYTTDTEPGSSGSPVFNNTWDLVALHYAAGEQDSSGNWLSNEGIRADKIVANLRANVPVAIRNELGI